MPFLFVSSTAFQSMYYGQTDRKIRTYFKALRKAAREEGGAIGFIEEIDAIAGARSGMQHSPAPVGVDGAVSYAIEPSGVSEGISGVVNELLIQLQSFDEPTFGQRFRGCVHRHREPLAAAIGASDPASRCPRRRTSCVIGATNRAADLDPALLRPGRFDRSIHFDLPSRSGRREIIDYYLDKKAHVPELDKEERRDQLAAMTFGYSPVMIEHLFDEALVWALRDGRDAMDWHDVQQAKLTEEIGLKQPVEYTDEEKLHDRDPRSRPRGRRAPRRPRPQARGAVDHQAPRRARPARPLRQGGALHEDPYRAHRLDQDRVRRHDRRGAVLRRGRHRSGRRPRPRDARRGTDGRLARHGGLARFLRGDRVRTDHAGHRRQGARQRRRVATPSRRMLEQAKDEVRKLLDENRHLVVALRDALLERDELVGDEIMDVLRESAQRDALERSS